MLREPAQQTVTGITRIRALADFANGRIRHVRGERSRNPRPLSAPLAQCLLHLLVVVHTHMIQTLFSESMPKI